MSLRLACLDWYPGFDQNHIYIRLISRALSCNLICSSTDDADIILVGPYGRNKELIKKKRGQIVIYGSGENTRPDYRFCDISFTLDQCTYDGRNIRIPAWAGEFDFWGDSPSATRSASNRAFAGHNLPLTVNPFNSDSPVVAAILVLTSRIEFQF